MRKSSLHLVFISALLGVFAAPALLASGSYSGRPPQPPANSDGGTTVDRNKYALGKNVFEGSVMTPGGSSAETQLARLKAAQMQLPAEVAKTKDLPALAGKLSAAQLEGLEYYVAQRFAMKK